MCLVPKVRHHDRDPRQDFLEFNRQPIDRIDDQGLELVELRSIGHASNDRDASSATTSTSTRRFTSSAKPVHDDKERMGKTLTHRLDDACEALGLEWLVLPLDQDRESWGDGPYWGALVTAQYPRRRGRAARFFRYNGEAQVPRDRRPDPEVIYITLQPSGRRGLKRLLLAQIA
jgi:hypothetical protein